MGSSREYWQYARECARWAAEAKAKEDQADFLEMARAWTNIALVEADVARQAKDAFKSKHTAKRPSVSVKQEPQPSSGRG
jgi:hypothetical protein